MYRPKRRKDFIGRWVFFKNRDGYEIFKVESIFKEPDQWRKCGYVEWLRPVKGTADDRDCSGFDAKVCKILTDEELAFYNL